MPGVKRIDVAGLEAEDGTVGITAGCRPVGPKMDRGDRRGFDGGITPSL